MFIYYTFYLKHMEENLVPNNISQMMHVHIKKMRSDTWLNYTSTTLEVGLLATNTCIITMKVHICQLALRSTIIRKFACHL